MSNSYTKRPVAQPKNHEIYESLLNHIGIDGSHIKSTENRGLTYEQIRMANYASTKEIRSNHMMSVLGNLEKQYDLNGVPGFFKNESGIRTMASMPALAIACRDYLGRISSIVLRPNKPKMGKKGKPINKYMAFSSNGKTDGAPVIQTTHCPVVNGTAKERAGDVIGITEGVLKADVATALGNTYIVGMHGLNLPYDLAGVIEELEVSEIIIYLDAGEDGNKDMIKAKCKLIQLAKEIGIDYKVATWNPEHGKGIDDILKAGKGDEIRYLKDEEIQNLLTEGEEVDPLNGDWVYCVATEKFHNKRTYQSLKKSQFADKFMLEKTDVVNSLIAQGFDQVDSVTFLPNGSQIVVEEGLRKLNEWRDPEIVPCEGDVSIFIDHVQYLFPDKRDQDIFLDWFAYNIQFPGKKIMWALVILGGQGIGKSFFAFIFRNLLGEFNVSCPTNEQIHDKYTDWQKGCQLVIIEELMARGRIDLLNKLKPIITELWTMIREMYTPPHRYPNRFNIIAFTNHENALPIDNDDRRYGILESKVTAQGTDYYNRLWSWAEKPESTAALLHYFKQRDISHFKRHARAPSTKAKEAMIEASRTPLEQWIIGGIEDNCWPFNRNLVAIRHLTAEHVCPHQFRSYSPQKWAEALKKAGAVRYPKAVTLSDKSRATIWIVQEQEFFINENPQAIGEQYEGEQKLFGEQDINAVNPLDVF